MAYVYIYRSGHGSIFKIGRTTDFEERLKTHATVEPEPLTEFGVIQTERASQWENYTHVLRTKLCTRSDATVRFEAGADARTEVVADDLLDNASPPAELVLHWLGAPGPKRRCRLGCPIPPAFEREERSGPVRSVAVDR
jgi:hypothetical protein